MKKCDYENEILRSKHWIKDIETKKEEKWLADSGATTHVTNTEKYLFNKIKDRSTIVIGTGKETKATSQGNVIICHSITNQLIKLKNVLLVPEFQENIMNIPALLNNTFKIQASENKFEITQNHQAIPLEKNRIASED